MTDLRRTPLRRLLLLSALMGGASLVEDTATGNPVTFETDVAKPLVSLIASFLPVQTGSGDPSPDNVRPITGWDAVNVGHCEKNMFNGIREDGFITDGGVIGSDGYNEHSQLIRVEAGKKYTYSIGNCVEGNKRVHGYDILGNWVQMIQKNASTPAGSFHSTFTVPQGVYFIRVQLCGNVYHEDQNIQIEEGETATAYEPYNGTVYPATFPSTIYGGYVDLVTGEVWATWVAKPIANIAWYSSSQSANGVFGSSDDFRPLRSLKSPVNIISDEYKTVESSISISAMPDLSVKGHLTSKYQIYLRNSEYTTREEFIQYARSSNAVICYEIDSPQLITTLTPQQITAIKGNNTIWSDANSDCSVTFLKKGT